MRSAIRITAALAFFLLMPDVAAAQEEPTYSISVRPDPLFTARTVVIETDLRLGAQNAGQERRVKNEIERLFREWGRYEVVNDREDAELTITLVTNDQVSFFEGIYEPLTEFRKHNKILFLIANNGDEEYLVWVDGTTDSFTGRRTSGNQRRGWDNTGSRRIAALFVKTLRDRVESEEPS